MRFEQTCEDWQKVRRCASASGELRYECVARSPLAKLWSMLRDRPEDDEVRVEVIRRAPDDSPEPAGAAQADAQASSTEGRQTSTKRIVKVKQGEELPACKSDG